MRIAVNTIFLQKDQLEGYGYFVQEVCRRWVLQHPEHEFIFLFDREYDPSFIFSANVKAVVVKPKARHALSFKWWYDVKLPVVLRSVKADVVLQPYGFCSSTSHVPQLLMVHDLAFIHHPQFIPKHHLWYYKLFTGSFIRTAKRMATVSAFSKQDIIQHYKTAADKIDVVYSAAKPVFQPIHSFEKTQSVKDRFADGREYFLFVGGIHPRKNLFTLLKAFSKFKKWQRSNMKLLVAGRLAWQYDDILEKLKTYKYREDVVMLDYVKEDTLAEIMASAYALVFPSYFEGFGVPLLEAMQSGVPVITGNSSSLPEIAGEAALFADPDDDEALSQHMIRLYKDEALRNLLIAKGFERAAHFSWDRTADLLWQSLMATARA